MFAIVGFLISLMGGIVVGNQFINILTSTLISTLVFAGLGMGLYMFLEQKVPEFIDFLNEVEMTLNGDLEFDNSSEDGKKMDTGDASAYAEENSAGIDTNAVAAEENQGDTVEVKPAAKDNSKFGDHIMVDNIAIKNEPKLMAEAIRTIMAQDDSGGGISSDGKH
ncbi:MAG: hypothetical protein H7A24_02425 [Leptospiraceae bacterium]|nr:hypothetical protein [Leptospiraceae bacterium]